MKIAILLGLPLSGKTTHAREINNYIDYSIPLVETGPIVLKAVADQGVETTPENIKRVVGSLKKEKGDAIFTVMAVEEIMNTYNENDVVFLSGVKARSEVDVVENLVGEDNVFLVSFHASFKTRHSRLLNEDRVLAAKQSNKTTEDMAMANDPERLRLRDYKELSYGLGDLMATADYVVNTEDKRWPHKSFDDTINQFKTIISELSEM